MDFNVHLFHIRSTQQVLNTLFLVILLIVELALGLRPPFVLKVPPMIDKNSYFSIDA